MTYDNLKATDNLLIQRGENSYKTTVAILKTEIGGGGDLTGYATETWCNERFPTKTGTGASGTWGITAQNANRAVVSNDADKLDGEAPSYYLNYDNFTNKPTIPTLSSSVSSTSTTVGANSAAAKILIS